MLFDDSPGNSKQIFMSMIEAKFHLFQIQEKVTSAHSIIASKFGFRKAPEVLDAVDMAALGNCKGLAVVDSIVSIAVGDEPVVASEGVGVDGRSFRDALPDNCPERFSRYVWNGGGVDFAVSLENAEYRDFPGSSSPALALTNTAEVTLVNLMLPVVKRRFCFAGKHDTLANERVDAVSRMAIDGRFQSRPRGRDFKDKITDEFIGGSVVELGPFDDFTSHEYSLGQRIS